MVEKKIGCLGILGIFLAFLFMISFLGKGIKETKPPDSKIIEKTKDLKSYEKTITQKEVDHFEVMSPAEHLKIAKEELQKYDFKKMKFGNLELAKKHLAAIPKNSIEYNEVNKLEPRIEQIEKEIHKQSKIFAQKIMAKQRKEFAEKLEIEYLKKGMDIHVTTSGKNNELLKIKWVLLSRPLVFNLINNENFLSNLDKMEFKKLILTDGFRNTWTLVRTPLGWK